jgi:phosphoglycerate dehydrogenase-like enzyme
LRCKHLLDVNSARVAVTSRSFSKHPVLRSELLQRYPNVTFNDAGKSLTGADLIDFLRGHQMAITALEKLDQALFAALPELRVISKYGVGLDMIDLDAMQTAGVRLGWTPGVNRRSVAELVIAAAIALLHRVTFANREVREGRWRQVVGNQLTGRTVGIIGCGHIGKEVAVLVKAFGCSVVANDIVDYREFYQEHQVRPVSLEELLVVSDVVTLHVPLDASTEKMLSAVRLRAMKKGSVLINMARGGLVDEGEVKAMLRDGHLAGAAFDVFSSEPPDDRELLALPNVWITPHIGGSTEEAILAMGRAAIDGLDSALNVAVVMGRPS